MFTRRQFAIVSCIMMLAGHASPASAGTRRHTGDGHYSDPYQDFDVKVTVVSRPRETTITIDLTFHRWSNDTSDPIEAYMVIPDDEEPLGFYSIPLGSRTIADLTGKKIKTTIKRKFSEPFLPGDFIRLVIPTDDPELPQILDIEVE